MYKFTVYRIEGDEAPSMDDRPYAELTCTYETLVRLVERLNVANPGYKYYFVRESEFISRLEYCKAEIRRTHEQIPPLAEKESDAYITAWHTSGCITWNEAEQLRAYNAELARSYAE